MPVTREGYSGNSFRGTEDISTHANPKYSVGSSIGEEALPIPNYTCVYVCY